MGASKVCYTRAPPRSCRTRSLPPDSLSSKSLPQGSLPPRASLERTFLKGASLQKGWFQRALCKGAFLQTASLQRAFLNETSRQRASLERTFVKGASLQKGWLQRALFKGASLQTASLQRAFLNETSRQRASGSLTPERLPSSMDPPSLQKLSSNGTSNRSPAEQGHHAYVLCARWKNIEHRRFLLLLPAAWGNYMYLDRLLQLRVFFSQVPVIRQNCCLLPAARGRESNRT